MSIRAARPEDIPAMRAIYAPFVLHTAISFEFRVPSEEEFAQRFQSHSAQCPWLVWEESGQVLGYAYAGPAFARAAYAWNAEISCYLADGAQRRGIGRQLYAQLETMLRQQGYRKIFALVTSANTSSLAFHRALGYREAARFQNVGFKLGQWHDVLWLEKELQPLGKPQQAPRPWREVAE